MGDCGGLETGSIGRIFLLEIGSEVDRERVGLPAVLSEVFDFGLDSKMLFACGVWMRSKLNSKSKKESSSSSTSFSLATEEFGGVAVEALGFQNLRKYRVSMAMEGRETERSRDW